MKEFKKMNGIVLTVVLFFLYSSTSYGQHIYNKMIWADEFNDDGLPDSSRWSYDTGNGCPNMCGWGNNELQYYTGNRSENARIENGNLIIEAKKENYKSAKYTSARLLSKNKGDWKYGRIEARANLPAGTGMWPAIWMLPTHWKYGGWPHSGEIDIMENVGYWPDSALSSIHTGAYNHSINTQKTKGVNRSDLTTAFHVYGIEWTSETVSFYIDDLVYHVFKNEKSGSEAWPFDQEFHLLLNVAVGGNWGGKYGVDDGIFPQRMEVDYVRVYQ